MLSGVPSTITPPFVASKHMFTKSEDEKLAQLVKTFGVNDWSRIVKHMPNRNLRQCKERWTYYLDPNINNALYTLEEDINLLNKVKEHGKKWTVIATLFDKRTAYSLKNRYQYLQRKLKRIGEKGSVEEIHEMPPPKPKPRPKEKPVKKEEPKIKEPQKIPPESEPIKQQEPVHQTEEDAFEEESYMSPQTEYTFYDEVNYDQPF